PSGWRSNPQSQTVSQLLAPLHRYPPPGSLELADRSNTPSQPPQLAEGHRILFVPRRESPRFTESGNRSRTTLAGSTRFELPSNQGRLRGEAIDTGAGWL